MAAYLGAVGLLLLIGMVLVRVRMLAGRRVTAMTFGRTDKSDFAIPPFALLYIYLVLANAFHWPSVVHGSLVSAAWLAWTGVLACAMAVTLMFASLVSFGVSFRVGIDTEHPGKLITSGVFAYTRNPIYVAFGFMLLGEFLIWPNWLLLTYLFAGFALFQRQVLREESYLSRHYGPEYEAYCRRVHRYL